MNFFVKSSHAKRDERCDFDNGIQGSMLREVLYLRRAHPAPVCRADMWIT